MLPRVVVVGRKDDALGKTLASTDEQAPFVLEFCANRHTLLERMRERPAALVVGLKARRSAPVISLVRRVKNHCPEVPVVVACLDQETSGRDVLSIARAGAEHFAFDQIDDVDAVIRTLVTPTDSDPSGAPAPNVDEIGLARARATARRSSRRGRFAERTPTPMVGVLPPTSSPLLRRIIHSCLMSSAPRDVATLALQLGLPRRSLTRETVRRGWPSPRTLLMWGRLFRGALAGAKSRLAGESWSETQQAIARGAGYQSARTASRAYRSRAHTTLRDIWREGSAALLPAFLAAVDAGLPPRRLAS